MHDCNYYEYDTFAQHISPPLPKSESRLRAQYQMQKCLGLEEWNV